MLRALAAQEKSALRLRVRDTHGGPKDDLDYEWDQLMEAHRAAGKTRGQPGGTPPSLPSKAT